MDSRKEKKMIASFEAHACAVEEVEEDNTFLIALADQAQAPQQYIELQRAMEYDEQDVDTGMDTYCVVTHSGAVHYGGIISCVLTDDNLALVFSEPATAALGFSGYTVALALSPSEKAMLRTGLMKLFDQDKNRPNHLIL